MEPVLSQTIYPEFAWYWAAIVGATIFVGIIMLGFEIFVFPGFGAAGIVGLVFLLGGTVTSWIALGPTWGALVSVSTCVLATATFILGMKSKFVQKRLVLKMQQPSGKGVESKDLIPLIGKAGETRSDLRPAGIAMVDDQRIDVVSDGGFIEKGESIKVIAVDGPRVVVERTSQKKENGGKK